MRSMHAFKLSGSRERLKNKEESEQLKKERPTRARKRWRQFKKKKKKMGLRKMTVNESFSQSQEDRKMLM